jgi:hypothetical protein
VNVYRKALASQPDGSVVIVGIGYEENLSALLNSQPDAVSPLDGSHLVAQKVKMLVPMGGGYPSHLGENNLVGNPGAARDVATNWPTKVVWSGYEVGDAIHTGQTISRVQPVDSPVRVAYEAFVGPNNWIYSYDPTAVYHAIRPNDQLLSEVGPGTNAIDARGGNVFTVGPGNQYYLKLGDATTLDSAIERLLDVVPGDTTPPLISNVTATPTATSAVITWNTNEPSTSAVDYGTTTGYGSSTSDNSMTTIHSVTIHGLTPAVPYHYQVRSSDAAGNNAVSGDQTFTPALGVGNDGPNDNFDSNTVDPTKWSATFGGSTVMAANQELEITHPAGPWTTGMVESAPFDATGRSVEVHVIRPANGGQSNQAGYGETSVILWADSTHMAEIYFAGGALTAWSADGSGSGEVNLTPSWPSYSANAMQWVRFRESTGMLYFEYAAVPTGPWTTLASVRDPFPMSAVTLRIVAGTNVSANDTAAFDDVSTTLLDVVPGDTTPPVISSMAAAPTATGAVVTWNTDEPSTSAVDYGTTTRYGASTSDNSITRSHSLTIQGLTPSVTYHYEVRSTDAAGNTSVSGDDSFTPAPAGPPGGPNDNFNSNALDPAKWAATSSGSTVIAANQELEIAHPAGPWTSGTVVSAPFDATGRSVQVHVIRPANGGQSNGTEYGETSVILWADSTHMAEIYFAGGALTAWSADGTGSGEVNLTPNWPRYNPSAMQWVRFRESGGMLYFEYAPAATGSWTTLASVPDPFPMSAVTLRIVAGTNLSASDTARFDDISTG